MLVLVVGDLHVPDRASSIPPAFKAILSPGKVQHIFCTGNLNDENTYNYLKGVCCNVHAVKGEFDRIGDLEQTKILEIGGVKIGLTSGHQLVPWGDKDALSVYRRQLGVDILFFGHTHQLDAFTYDGGFFINPGSTTGAPTALLDHTNPSMVLLDLSERSINLYLYELIDGQCVVSKCPFHVSS